MVRCKNKDIIKILDQYKNLWSLSYVTSIAHWDLETYMPSKGSFLRGEALGRVSVIRQKLFLDKSFTSLVVRASKAKDLNDVEKGMVRILLQTLDYYKKVPATFLEESEHITNTATVVWREAKKKDDFSLFEGHLKKIFDMNRKLSDYLGYKNHPYDALLDLFEEDLTTAEVQSFFETIKDPLNTLLNKIVRSDAYQKVNDLENAKYDKNKMRALNKKVLNDFWSEQDRFRLDVSTHPFTIGFGNNDTRITTWYHDTDFARSLLATIHEFGHALYELQSDDSLEMTPAAGGSSLVIHESQSRFWENYVGRSREFIKKYIKDMSSVVGRTLTVDDVYLCFNKISPGFLRVEADEVTYHFHIALRFEIEKAIIEGSLKVKDIKEVWNQKMKDYLGIIPRRDSQGILQDIHWSGGSVGYFPTYSMGTFLGAQWEQKTKNELKSMDYKKIKDWLRTNIHQYGSTYTLSDLLKKHKMNFDPSVNIKYLEDKYKKIYK